MMTPKEAWEAGLPGTYMGDDGNGGPSDFFPAMSVYLNLHEINEDSPWIPTPEELEHDR